MDDAIAGVLREYEQRADTEFKYLASIDPQERAKRDEFLLFIGRATGKLLNLLIKETGAASILEVGTAYGYSTVWLAEAARQTGGKVISLDVHGYKQEAAKEALWPRLG
jgi:predicted O-methyltransferase YrrM